jgi:hypothetical protein
LQLFEVPHPDSPSLTPSLDAVNRNYQQQRRVHQHTDHASQGSTGVETQQNEGYCDGQQSNVFAKPMPMSTSKPCCGLGDTGIYLF